jgi:hypothetical protein
MERILSAFKGKKAYKILTAVCAACVAVPALLAAVYLLSFTAPDAALYASGKNNAGFRVYYLDNDVYGAGPAPLNLFYLISFTDRIEIVNSFSAEFSQDIDISYSYSAVATLRVKYINSSGSTDPAVYEEKRTLAEDSGAVFGNAVQFPNSVYTVDPREYIDIYKRFITRQRDQMVNEDVITDRTPMFTADLLIDFIYTVSDPLTGLNEMLTRGCEIPLTSEVYCVNFTGTPSFDVNLALRSFTMPAPAVLALIALWFAVNIFGLCRCLLVLASDDNVFRRELKKIISKYSDDIIITTEPADFSGLKTADVAEFRELIKLAAGEGKHIQCYRDEGRAEFHTVSDGCAYRFSLRDEPAGEETE